MKSIDKGLNWRIGFTLGALLLIYGCVSPNVAPLRYFTPVTVLAHIEGYPRLAEIGICIHDDGRCYALSLDRDVRIAAFWVRPYVRSNGDFVFGEDGRVEYTGTGTEEPFYPRVCDRDNEAIWISDYYVACGSGKDDKTWRYPLSLPLPMKVEEIGCVQFGLALTVGDSDERHWVKAILYNCSKSFGDFPRP